MLKRAQGLLRMLSKYVFTNNIYIYILYIYIYIYIYM